MTFTSEFYSANGQNLHVMSAGPKAAPVMLMLHGFPEYWASWSKIADSFADRYRVILPDQRGYNLSSKPTEDGAYETKHLVADMKALLDLIAPDQPVVLCGHDWGASVAYAFAMRHSDLVSHLIIANGVHPVCFQKALLAGGPQTDASQYMNLLRSSGIEEKLSANNFEKMMMMLEKFSSAPWLDDETRAAYREAWSHGGALTAMLNWYRQSPMIVPPSGTPAQELPITTEIVKKYPVSMPHLLLWGMRDTALLPEARTELDQFCDNLTLHEHSDASHWILHEQPAWVVEKMREFLDGTVAPEREARPINV